MLIGTNNDDIKSEWDKWEHGQGQSDQMVTFLTFDCGDHKKYPPPSDTTFLFHVWAIKVGNILFCHSVGIPA